jgi:hypothetical protein
MKTFNVTANKTQIGTVTAETYTEAAALAVKLVNPKSKNLAGIRVTGDSEKSGMFQGYTAGNPQSAVGPNFHLRML